MQYSETTVIFKAADGRRWLRGLPAPTDEDLVNAAVALGAVAWTTLGTATGEANMILTDVDYAADGTIVKRSPRTVVPHRITYGPMHDPDCPPCVADAEYQRFVDSQRNRHRPGTKARAKRDAEDAAVRWATNPRSETYWSS
jgi:hypothetical protein